MPYEGSSIMKEDRISQTKFPSGAVRDIEKTNARYDLITPVGLRRLAETYGEGAEKYGDENWLKGIDCKNLMNHALTHINSYMAGDTSEDHLAHAAWNLFAIMHNEELLPHMQNITNRFHLAKQRMKELAAIEENRKLNNSPR